jgi:carbon storage regulator
MLVLTRRRGESIVVADDIRITVGAIHGGQVRLGIEAPRSVRVDRQEVAAQRRLGVAAILEEEAIAT